MEPTEKTCPWKWGQHVFTDDEKNRLLNGEVVHLDDCTTHKGNVFAVDVKLVWTDGTISGGCWQPCPTWYEPQKRDR